MVSDTNARGRASALKRTPERMHASRLGPDRRELFAWLGASAGWMALTSGCTSRSASLR